MAAITLKNIRKSFGDVEVIKGVDIDIGDGEFVVFVGPSGCGKSTLLRLIAGLEDISGGELWIGDRMVNDLEPKERAVAMVFQSYAIFPHMTVRENIAFGLTIRREGKAEIERKVMSAAKMLQMEELLDRRPSQLSGGQRQRVAIGRAIVRDPSVFLFDEPLSNLDAALRMSTRQEIAALHQQIDSTMIYVTHDQVEAMTLADRIVVLKDGLVMQTGSPMELFNHPANKFVASFIGAPSINFMDVTVEAVSGKRLSISGADLTGLELPLNGRDFEQGQALTFGLRPQHVGLASSGNGRLTGTVLMTERLGTETVIELKLGSGALFTVALAEDLSLETGEDICLDFDPAKVHLFDE